MENDCSEPSSFGNPNAGDVEEARSYLKALLRKIEPSPWTRPKNQKGILHRRYHREVLALLTAHPCLSKETFSFGESYSVYRSPVSILITDYASLDTIRSVYELCPSAMSEISDKDRLPLHFACDCGAEDDVVEFLSQKYPQAAFIMDKDGCLPIHLVLQQSDIRLASYRVLETLVKLNPESVLRPVNRSTPLDCVLNFSGYRHEVLDLFLSRVPRGLTSFQVNRDCFLSLDTAASLSKFLLPQLQDFTCLAQSQSHDGFECIMKNLERNTTIKKLSYALPRYLAGSNDADLRSMIKENATIEQFTFRGDSRKVDSYDQYIPAILDGFQNSRHPRKSLVLQDMSLSDPELLIVLMHSQSIPKQIVLEGISIDDQLLVSSKSWNDSPIEDISLNLCNVRLDLVVYVLSRLHQLPRLKKVTFGVCFLPSQVVKKADITDFVGDLILKNIITSLTLDNVFDNLDLDVKRICEAMESNTSLKFLDIYWALETEDNLSHFSSLLESHNTTLETIPLTFDAFETSHGQQIAYYTKLNQYGRGVAREGTTRLFDFVSKLISAAALKTPFEERNVLYGLLRDTPTLWTRPARRKRKRS